MRVDARVSRKRVDHWEWRQSVDQEVPREAPLCRWNSTQRRPEEERCFYEVLCKLCLKQTSRTLKRLSEHKNAVRKQDTNKRIAVHSWTNQHQVHWEVAKTREVEGNYWKKCARSAAHPPTAANIQLRLWADHQSFMATATWQTIIPLTAYLLFIPHRKLSCLFIPLWQKLTRPPITYNISRTLLKFEIAEENLQNRNTLFSIKVASVFMLKNLLPKPLV